MTKILIAAHKECNLPSDEVHLPIHVGAALASCDIGFMKDDSGNNISELNPFFSELTGLYWAWKNLDADYIGLEHYRRRFVLPKEWMPAGGKCYLPRRRRYYIESLYSHYAHTHNEEHLVKTRQIISEMCPEYLDAYDKALSGTSGYMFNMLIMPKNMLDAYCNWLFPILFALHKRVNSGEYSAFDKRYVGRIGELLLNVWVEKNKPDYEELFCKESSVKPMMKIHRFLLAKAIGKKYEKSI